MLRASRRPAKRLADALYNKSERAAATPDDASLLLTRHTDAQFLSAAEHRFVFDILPTAVNALYTAHGAPQKLANTPGLGHAQLTMDRNMQRMHQAAHQTSLAMNPQVSSTQIQRDNFVLDTDERMELMKRLLSLSSANGKMIRHWDVQRAVEMFKRQEGDTGSSEVQIAILSVKIKHLEDHLNAHKKDLHSARGLMLMKSKRDRLLNYLKHDNLARYHETLAQIGL